MGRLRYHCLSGLLLLLALAAQAEEATAVPPCEKDDHKSEDKFTHFTEIFFTVIFIIVVRRRWRKSGDGRNDANDTPGDPHRKGRAPHRQPYVEALPRRVSSDLDVRASPAIGPALGDRGEDSPHRPSPPT